MATIEPYETAAGKRYRVRYRKPDGRQTDKRGFTRKRDAELFAASVEVKKATGEYIDPSRSRSTILELGERWLATQTHLKPSTQRSVDSTWRIHVLPRWGGTNVGDIEHSDVQEWISGLAASKSATTVKRAHGILSAILDRAVRDRRLPSNPAQKINLPRKTLKDRAYLTHEQVDLLAVEAGHHGSLVLTLAYTGLRWGEASALRVRDVDFLRRRVHVVENAVMVGGRIEVGTPKSHRSRTVAIPAFLVAELSRLCRDKPREALLFGDGVAYERLPNSKDGWFAGAVKRARSIDRAFPRVTPHDLRHTAASLAISSGANVKAVQRMLGHASAAMTLDVYADLFDDDLDAVATGLDLARGQIVGAANFRA